MTDGDLSPDEIAALRAIIEQQKRAAWFWSSIRVWSAWISAGIVGGYTLWEIFSKVGKKSGLG